MGGGTNVKPQSLDGGANILIELAGLLQAGRPEPAISAEVSVPAAHEEVAAKTQAFAEWAHNNFEDAVALIAALSMRLKVAANGYNSMDATVKQHLDSFLGNSTYVGP